VGYTKLFSEIIMSTIWREPNHVRLVWITMLAMKDRWHRVEASLPGLADAARVSIEDCEAALKVLAAPDKYSRTTEYDGRRIEKDGGGWCILNGEKWRNKMSLDERREYNRLKQREYRQKNKDKAEGNQHLSTSCQQKSTKSAHTDTDTDTDTKNKDQKLSSTSVDSKRPSTPITAFKNTFDTHNSSLPRLAVMTAKRRSLIKARWGSKPDMEFWADFWKEVEESDFLSGRMPGRNGGKPFTASFDWCLNETNFAKIVEGNYVNR